MRIKEITATRVHYGYRRVHVMLRREGWSDNQKRVYRLYRAEGLSLRLKRPKRNKSARLRQPKQLATAINQIWSMDFVADALFDGRRLRALTVVDNYTRESLAIDVGQSLKGEDVVDTLNRIAAYRGLPETIKVDNGSEFISKVMDKWAYERGVELDFSRPGKPTDNAKVESFNGRFRQECLNAHWFLSLDDAKAKIEEWRQYYIMRRVPTPHCSGPRHPNSPVWQGKRPKRTYLRSRNFLLQAGTNSGVGSPRGRLYIIVVLFLGSRSTALSYNGTPQGGYAKY